MKIEMRNGSVSISGYVNAVERESRLIPSPKGPFVEKVRAGAFERALVGGSVELRLDHGRVIGGTGDGSLALCEDAIGLRAEAAVSDPETVELARRGEIRGWSFGFKNPSDEWEEGEPPKRTLLGFDLLEVSLISRRMVPAYTGTLAEVRGEPEAEFLEREAEPEVRTAPDNVHYWRELMEMKRNYVSTQ